MKDDSLLPTMVPVGITWVGGAFNSMTDLDLRIIFKKKWKIEEYNMYYYLTIYNSNNHITHRFKSKQFLNLIRHAMGLHDGFAFTTFPLDDSEYTEY